MSIEVDWQAKVVAKIKAEGGHGRKLSSAYATGVLDLMLVHPLFKTIFVEAKMVKPSGPRFNLRMNYTEKQKEEAWKIITAGGCALGLAMVYYKPTEVYLSVVPVPPMRQTFNVTNDMIDKEQDKWHKTGLNLSELFARQIAERWNWLHSGVK